MDENSSVNWCGEKLHFVVDVVNYRLNLVVQCVDVQFWKSRHFQALGFKSNLE